MFRTARHRAIRARHVTSHVTDEAGISHVIRERNSATQKRCVLRAYRTQHLCHRPAAAAAAGAVQPNV